MSKGCCCSEKSKCVCPNCGKPCEECTCEDGENEGGKEE